jgi:transposase
MSATRNKFSPEFRDRAVRMVEEHRGDYPSEWAAMSSIAAKPKLNSCGGTKVVQIA